MASVVVYDPSNNYVIQYLPSANTPDWEGNPNALINPSVPLVPMHDWIHDAGAIREMTQLEKDARDAAQLAQDTASLRTQSSSAVSGRVTEGMLIRALALVTMDEINLLRAAHSLAPRTGAQLKTAIQNKIQSGDAD